jgi:hypothetical protein
MNALGGIIEHDLNIIHETSQKTGHFVMKVDILFLNHLGTAHFTEDLLEASLGFLQRVPIPLRGHDMALRISQSADAVRTARARGEVMMFHLQFFLLMKRRL